ncbi:S-adenosylmethionine decarboxylase [archaeon AH-315-M20]|nr:S-adenosylmethionine decarboxylase [archaeon AH-315-M20]
MKDLAPTIFRQRLIIEGTCTKPITSKQIKKYLMQLSNVINMKALKESVTHKSKKYGWAAWIHWETSGCHFYAWDKPKPFFSSDIYTCKRFDVKKAVEFTKEFFKATKIVYKRV